MRKEAEEALARQAEELERSNAELEQFAYVASHDLQEPLRMVTRYLDLLELRYKGRLDSDADDFIFYAVDGANRMSHLLKDLLAYSRVDSRGKDFEPTDCEALLERTLLDLNVAIDDSGAEVTHDPLPTVTADDVQLGQLFQNLIGNAIKFRDEESPHVHVSATPIAQYTNADFDSEIRNPWPRRGLPAERPIGCTSRQGRPQSLAQSAPGRAAFEKGWVFSVRDNGIGFDSQFAERIFQVSQRLHTREEYPGTGIGLAICKKIVERHSGKIWVESEPGKGSTFYFTIPEKKE